jgi:hypothetical protein
MGAQVSAAGMPCKQVDSVASGEVNHGPDVLYCIDGGGSCASISVHLIVVNIECEEPIPDTIE